MNRPGPIKSIVESSGKWPPPVATVPTSDWEKELVAILSSAVAGAVHLSSLGPLNDMGRKTRWSMDISSAEMDVASLAEIV